MVNDPETQLLSAKLGQALQEVGELHMTNRELTAIVDRQGRMILELRRKYEPETLEAPEPTPLPNRQARRAARQPSRPKGIATAE